MKRRSLPVALIVLGLAAAAPVSLVASRLREPLHEGRRVSFSIDELGSPDRDRSSRAETALHPRGAPAIPCLADVVPALAVAGTAPTTAVPWLKALADDEQEPARVRLEASEALRRITAPPAGVTAPEYPHPTRAF